jgi:hypothetical protein
MFFRWTTPHQSLASLISALMTSSPQWPYRPQHTPTWSHGLQATFALSCKARTAAFNERDSNPEAYKKFRYALWRTIKQAKRQYRTKIEWYYTSSDARLMWQGLQTITDYKGRHCRELPSDTSLPDELNYFYARFKANNTETCMRESAVPDDRVITLSAADVSKTFKQARWITRTCTASMHSPTGKCLHWLFQPLPVRVYNTNLF